MSAEKKNQRQTKKSDLGVKAQNCNSHNRHKKLIIIQMRQEKNSPEQSLGTIPEN